MKVSKHVWIATLVLGMCTAAAFAQEEGGPPNGGGPMGEHRRPPIPPIVTALDANHDGVIDSNEIANASVALKTLDKNGDGQLTRDEFLPPRPANAPSAPANGHHPPLPIVQVIDANHDGVIDGNEIANAPAALLTLDKNHDGQLTRDEYLPPRPNGPQGGHAEMQGAPPGDMADEQGPPPPPPDEN